MAKFYVGLDLGQSRDYTAVVVAEKVEPSEASGRDYELHIRHLERFRDVLYPDVAERVRRLIDAPELRSKAALTVDATGVGAAVVDMLRKSGLTFDAVTITGGDTESQQGWDAWRVPKRDLIGGLQVLLQSGRLKIAYTLEHAETLKSELLNFRVKVNVSTGHDSYEAWREGDHDDLVLAAALAAWKAHKGVWTPDDSESVSNEPRARNREHETMPSLAEDKRLSLLASSVAYECFGDCVEAIAELALEELAPYHLMIRYIEAERI